MDNIGISESDFMIKQNFLVTITPFFQIDVLSFISGEFGPFKPNKPVVVPLWLALYLKQRNKCRIAPPDWLNEEVLQDYLQNEKNQKDELTIVPYEFFEIGHIFLKESQDDLIGNHKIKILIEDIEAIRDNKIQEKCINLVNQKSKIIQIDNITSFEINKRRQIMTAIYNQVGHIQNIIKEDERQQQSSYNTQQNRNSQYY